MKKSYIYILGIIFLTIIIFFIFISVVVNLQKGKNNLTVTYHGDEYVVDSKDYVVAHPEVIGLPLEDLTEAEKAGLLRMREEEKLARDVYTVLYKTWGMNIFRNIAQSEATHTEAVRYLIKRNSLVDPIKNETVGVFTDPEILKLYNDLTLKGKESQESALWVGALIEDLDIYDLQKLSKISDNQDILAIYSNLLRGSINHLQAFNRQLERLGKTYETRYISEQDFNNLIMGLK